MQWQQPPPHDAPRRTPGRATQPAPAGGGATTTRPQQQLRQWPPPQARPLLLRLRPRGATPPSAGAATTPPARPWWWWRWCRQVGAAAAAATCMRAAQTAASEANCPASQFREISLSRIHAMIPAAATRNRSAAADYCDVRNVRSWPSNVYLHYYPVKIIPGNRRGVCASRSVLHMPASPALSSLPEMHSRTHRPAALPSSPLHAHSRPHQLASVAALAPVFWSGMGAPFSHPPCVRRGVGPVAKVCVRADFVCGRAAGVVAPLWVIAGTAGDRPSSRRYYCHPLSGGDGIDCQPGLQ